MAPRKIYWAILTGLLLATLPACQKGRTEQEGDVKELTVIFATTTGLAGDGYNEPLMQSIMESVAANPAVKLHLLKPDNLSEARSQFDGNNH